MNPNVWLVSFIFYPAVVVALLRGKVIFKRPYDRDEDPQMFWAAIGVYTVLGSIAPLGWLLGFVEPAQRAVVAIGFVSVLLVLVVANGIRRRLGRPHESFRDGC